MARILVLYETVDGHTARVANRMAEVLRGRGLTVDVRDCRALLDTFSMRSYDGVLIGAPVRYGRFPRTLRRLVPENVRLLERIPAWFFSVGLAAAGGEQGLARGNRNIERFERATGFWPERTMQFAGALAYTKYRPLKRLYMWAVAKASGLDTDTSRDYSYTDWPAVRAFAREFAAKFVVEEPARRGEHEPVSPTATTEPGAPKQELLDTEGTTWVERRPPGA